MAYIDDPETQRANLNFIKASMREPLLAREVEFDLARRWREQNDERELQTELDPSAIQNQGAW